MTDQGHTLEENLATLDADVKTDITNDAARETLIAQLTASNAEKTAAAQAALDQANLAEADKAVLQARLDAANAAVEADIAALEGAPAAPAEPVVTTPTVADNA